MNELDIQNKNNWIPDKPVSKGAEGYHNAVIDASWNQDNLHELIEIIKPDIHENDIVIDFGAGTGASAISIIKHIKAKINLWLVDNSPTWLAKAHEILKDNPNISYFILEKEKGRYLTLDKVIGKNTANMVISANTFHLVPDLNETFTGILNTLKDKGMFVFQSGNIFRNDRPEGVLMIEDTIHRVHDISIGIINNNPVFKEYREGLNERIKSEEVQRKFIFNPPRPMETYLNALKESGFKFDAPVYKKIKVKYIDWMKFLRVRRLQAGILPEIGSRYPSPKEEQDRDSVITEAANELFKELEKNNPLADNESFIVEWAYVKAMKGKIALI